MFTFFIQLVAKVLVIPTVFLFSLAGYTMPTTPIASVVSETPSFGSFNPTGGGTYYLLSTVNNNQTTITLSGFTEPVSGIPYTMSYLNSSIEYGTIAPQTTLSEFISFTGITQNADGSATLTGVVRGLGRSYPYTASTTLAQPHAGQTRFILSNPPQLTNQYLSLANSGETVTGSKTFNAVVTFGSTTQPTYDANPAVWSSQLSLIDKAYADALSVAGGATSTFSNQGFVWLATNAQVSAGTASSTTGSPLVIPSKVASSTYNASTVFNGEIPTLGASFHLDPNFISTTSPYIFASTTHYILNAGTFTATTSVSLAATTTASGILSTSALGQTFTSATTTSKWPLAMVIATSTGRATTGSTLLASSTIGFIGFTQGNATNGSPIFVQTTGIVSGFTGLSVGSDYYLQDSGAIGTTVGTLEAYVGTAISTTQLEMESPHGLQYVGTAVDGGAVPPYVREVISNWSGTTVTETVSGSIVLMLTKGPTSGNQIWAANNSGGGAVSSYGVNCGASAGGTVACTTAGTTAVTGITDTNYFFR